MDLFLQIEKIIKDYDGLIVRNKTQVNSDILKNASNLKFIGRLGVGLDNIDTEYCKNENIHVQPATGMNADSVAEYVLSSSLSLIKKEVIDINQVKLRLVENFKLAFKAEINFDSN